MCTAFLIQIYTWTVNFDDINYKFIIQIELFRILHINIQRKHILYMSNYILGGNNMYYIIILSSNVRNL